MHAVMSPLAVRPDRNTPRSAEIGGRTSQTLPQQPPTHTLQLGRTSDTKERSQRAIRESGKAGGETGRSEATEKRPAKKGKREEKRRGRVSTPGG